MNTKLLEYILNGNIVINSLDVLGHWVKRFPDHPHLLKIYASLLATNNHPQAAAHYYDRSAQIFLKEGQFLQAIATKMAQWQAVRPQRQEIEAFLSTCRGQVPDGKPATAFWKSLNTDEFLDLCQISENSCHPSGITVKQLGEIEKQLYFVVSGELKESNYRMVEDPQAKFKKPIQMLGSNDIFGVIYPFSKDIRSQSHIVTLKRTELISLKKEKLIRSCKVHPQLEAKIIELLQIRYSKTSSNGSSLARKAKRYNLSTPIAVEILSESGNAPVRLVGFSRDLSVSGLCFLIPSGIIEDSQQAVLEGVFNGENSEARVILSIEKMSLSVPGRIVRKEKVLDNGQIHVAMGIRFDDLPPMLGGAFFALAQSAGLLNKGASPVEAAEEDPA
jgi:CRP-like cAMP-binding protein